MEPLQILTEGIHQGVPGESHGHFAGTVRGHQQTGGIPGRVIDRNGFLPENIQSGTGQMAAVQSIYDCILVDAVAAAHIYDEGTVVHHGNALCGNQIVGLGSAGKGQRQNVCPGKYGFNLFDFYHFIEVGGASAAAVDTDNLCGAESPEALGKIAADVAGAADDDGGIVDRTDHQIAAELLCPHKLVVFRIPAQHHQCHHDHMLGNGDTVGTGAVGKNGVRRQNLGFDQGVNAGIVAGEPLQLGGGFHQVGRTAVGRGKGNLDIAHMGHSAVIIGIVANGAVGGCCGSFQSALMVFVKGSADDGNVSVH